MSDPSLLLAVTLHFCRPSFWSILPVSSAVSFPPLSVSVLLSPALCLSLSGWVPAVELVGLVAGVTARLSGVASDQGGRRAARTIGAERLRLTAGHLSRAISVGAEAYSLLVGPAYCEDQRQSVSTHCSALSLSLLSSFPISASKPHSPFPHLCLLLLYFFEFSPDVLLQLSGYCLRSGNMLFDCSVFAFFHTLTYFLLLLDS